MGNQVWKGHTHKSIIPVQGISSQVTVAQAIPTQVNATQWIPAQVTATRILPRQIKFKIYLSLSKI